MGREAICACDWNGMKAEVKALIEPPELILRGGIRRRVPIAAMKQIKADGGRLHFMFNGEAVALDVGSDVAAKWAKALLTPPPSLAKKEAPINSRNTNAQEEIIRVICRSWPRNTCTS